MAKPLDRGRLDGVLVVDKPRGKTSHDVVAAARRLFGVRAVGHAGTLDPMATGVLVLLFGEACKLSSYLTSDDKTYRTTVRLGVGTDTLDADGAVVETRELHGEWLGDEALESALRAERERSLQVPPAISAIHSEGERAYARARRGETVELPPRPVSVERLELLAASATEVTVELTVSKGYYVRAFARDLGHSLGVPAHLTELRRLSSGGFHIDQAVAWPPSETPELLDVAAAAQRALPVTRLSLRGAERARRGQVLEAHDAEPGALDQVCAWLSPEGRIVALGVSLPTGEHRVTRGFAP